jgi:hypothetical protein
MRTFKDKIIRQKITSRGGGVEIALDTFGINGYGGGRMSAYQNYLGGGILGRVCSDCNIKDWKQDESLIEISEQLKEYFHGITNDDSVEGTSFEQNQKLPVSAY